MKRKQSRLLFPRLLAAGLLVGGVPEGPVGAGAKPRRVRYHICSAPSMRGRSPREVTMPHGRFLTRRDMLLCCANGFGAVALAALLAEDGHATEGAGPRRPVRHHPATATSVIFLYMDGGPSQVDTFDYKPLLEK